METWKFYLVLDRAELTDDDCDALHEAGCDDGTVVSRDGVTYIAFEREGESFEAVISSAVAEVMHTGIAVARAEVSDPTAPEGSHRVVWELESFVQEGLREYFSHFVALSGCYHSIDPSGKPTGNAGAFHCSGFILEVEGQWYWVTAGHVFDHEEHGIETLRRERKIEIDECVLNDSFSDSGDAWTPIPFIYWDWEPFSCYYDTMGLDIFAVGLRAQQRKLLEANGVVALSEVNWQHQKLSRFDGFILIGLPEELEETKITPEPEGYHVRTKPAPAAVHVCQVRDVPADCVKPTPRFVGRIEKEAGNIKGMSGGPIFGVCPRDSKHYLVAVQSSRSRTRQGLIFGCPAVVLVDRLLDK